MRIVCIGGGAASYFFAANVVEHNKEFDVIILEQGTKVLNKVLISGGGRCNVTHHCQEPSELIKYYPRGQKELLGPFYHFGPEQTVQWFESRGVPIKVEEDGRMFPASNSSSSIAHALTQGCDDGGVRIWTKSKVTKIIPKEGGKDGYTIELLNQPAIEADILFVGSGSSKGIWQQLGHLGLEIVPSVPSLFTFQIKDSRIKGLQGVSVPYVEISSPELGLKSDGALLITHKGFSAPSVLKMSAWGARKIQSVDYFFKLVVDWIPHLKAADINAWRHDHPKKMIGNQHLYELPKRLLNSLLLHSKLDPQKKWAEVSKQDIESLLQCLKQSTFNVIGQNRFKEEFVTAGGVELKEIDFKSFSSKKLQNMYLAGEVLNIDAVTGGFNFQAAWTGAYIASQSVLDEY